MTKSTTRSTADGEFLSGLDVTGALTADTITKVSTGDLDLLPISTTITDTAVDVFVYDTSKDSDGGAWRKRTQGTSWYNETLNTSTRGSRKEFPAVAVIVAETTQVTIYDGDDPAMPMWMVFNSGGTYPNTYALGQTNWATLNAVSVLNGLLCFPRGVGGMPYVSFIDEECYRISTDGLHSLSGGIVSRNSGMPDTIVNSSKTLVNGAANDIAMTVLPNAPIDSATGLPIPTIAVATDGGVSVIKDDGSVVDNTSTIYSNAVTAYIGFTEDNRIICSSRGTAYTRIIDIPASDTSSVSTTDLNFQRIDSFASTAGIDVKLAFDGNEYKAVSGVGVDTVAVGHTKGLGIVVPSTGIADYTLNSAIITSDYNTGYMVGDIKLAALSDTDDTDIGTELIVNGTFSANTTSWSGGSGGILAVDNGRLALSGPAGDSVFHATQAITTKVGSYYQLTFTTETPNSRIRIGVGTYNADSYQYIGGATTTTVNFTATSTSTYITLTGTTADTSFYFDNISIKEADTDRSVNANGLAVHGTITKSAVATGADLVGYSGFSGSNYLEQPYNSDLDFGTGDFSYSFWLKAGAAEYAGLIQRGTAINVDEMVVWIEPDGDIWWRLKTITNAAYVSGGIAANATTFVCCIKRAGVMEIWLNGVLSGSIANGDSVNTTSPLNIGAWHNNNWHLTNGSLALMRISATAPTAAQIKTIYEAEKPLFQENAQATLYGTSNAVTALAHDSDTDLLHVGTSSGRSVFQGLRRVDNTTTAVGAAISASNGLVVED